MKVAIDTSPLKTGHSTRGIGHYTRYLIDSLEKFCPNVELLKDTIEGADIIHYPYFDFYFLTLPLQKSKPTIVTIHDVIPLVFPDRFPSGIKGKIKLQMQQLSLRGVKAILTDSHHSKQDIVRYLHVPEKNVHVAHIAVDGKFRSMSSDETFAVKTKYHLPDSFFLYIGDVNYNKNIPGLVKAFAKLNNSNAHLVLVGKAFENREINEVKEIEQAIAQSQKSDRIHVLGFVPDEDVVALYNLATAYVQPSLYEGFGLPVLEAFHCGTPVISSDKASLKEIIGDASLVIDPENVDSIARAMEKVLADEVLLLDLSQRGSTQAQKFSQKSFADQTAMVYKKVYDRYCKP